MQHLVAPQTRLDQHRRVTQALLLRRDLQLVGRLGPRGASSATAVA